MRAGLFGFGRTGKAVAAVLFQNPSVRLEWIIRNSGRMEHRSAAEFLGVDSDGQGTIHPKTEFLAPGFLDENPVDVIIDFSSQDGIYEYGSLAAERGINIVSAVSNYPEETIEFARSLGQKTKVMWAPNITIGINFLIMAARVLNMIAPYTDVEIIEEHFKVKPEISGTAKIIAQKLDIPESDIKSVRAGGIIGTHEILFGFPHQTVRLKHESISREAFGNGALFAAQKLCEKEIGFYNMEDILFEYFSEVSKVQSKREH